MSSTRKQYVQISLDDDDLPTHYRQVLLFMNPNDYKALEKIAGRKDEDRSAQEIILFLVSEFLKKS